MGHPVFCLQRFVGGRLNMCHNAVDRHVEAGLGERKAIVWDSAITDSKSTLTYAQLRETLARHVPHYTIHRDRLNSMLQVAEREEN